MQGKIDVGDVLDNLNGVHICSATKGRLNAIFCNNKVKPITVMVIKAINPESQELYQPMIKLLRDVNLDPVALREKRLQNKEVNKIQHTVAAKQRNRYGFYSFSDFYFIILT